MFGDPRAPSHRASWGANRAAGCERRGTGDELRTPPTISANRSDRVRNESAPGPIPPRKICGSFAPVADTDVESPAVSIDCAVKVSRVTDCLFFLRARESV